MNNVIHPNFEPPAQRILNSVFDTKGGVPESASAKVCIILLHGCHECTKVGQVYAAFWGKSGMHLLQYTQLPDSGGWLWALSREGFGT